MAKVLLALSTFRHGDPAVRRGIEAAAGGELVLLYVVDVNVRRYLVGSGIGMLPALAEEAEQTLLQHYRELGQQRIERITELADAAGLPLRSELRVGRFAIETMAMADQERPDLIVTTRSGRPEWVLRLFGSPVETLRREAGCPVEVV